MAATGVCALFSAVGIATLSLAAVIYTRNKRMFSSNRTTRTNVVEGFRHTIGSVSQHGYRLERGGQCHPVSLQNIARKTGQEQSDGDSSSYAVADICSTRPTNSGMCSGGTYGYLNVGTGRSDREVRECEDELRGTGQN